MVPCFINVLFDSEYVELINLSLALELMKMHTNTIILII